VDKKVRPGISNRPFLICPNEPLFDDDIELYGEEHPTFTPPQCDTPIDEVSFDNIVALQKKNPLWACIMEYLRHGKAGPEYDEYVPTVRRCIIDYALGLKGELLYKFAQEYKVCVPKELREIALHDAHDVLAASHGGRQKTLSKLRSMYWWPSMHADVVDYLYRCLPCLKHKRGPRMKQPLGERPPPERVWERVHLDLWQPGGRSAKGNNYVAAFIDTVSKFIVAEPIRNKSAETIANTFINRVVCIYGMPEVLYSDGAAEFRGKLMSQLSTAFGVNRKVTTPYRPQANGQIERVFSTIRPMLATAVAEFPKKWDVFLPYVIYAYNTSYHSSIDNIPFYLFFGRDPHDDMFDVNRVINVGPGMEPSNKDRLHYLQLARQIAIKTMARKTDLRKVKYDEDAFDKSPDIGDLVMVKSIRPPDVEVGKLYPRFVGPFRVVEKKGESVLGVVPVGHAAARPRFIHADRTRDCPQNIRPSHDLSELLSPFTNPNDPSVIDSHLDQELPE